MGIKLGKFFISSLSMHLHLFQQNYPSNEIFILQTVIQVKEKALNKH